MKDQIITLTPRHFKIVDLAIKGFNTTQIAKQLNMSRTQVSIIINSPTFKHEFALRRTIHAEQSAKKQSDEEDEVLRTLKQGAIDAANKLVGHISSETEAISVKSCAEVLDRTGYGRKLDKQEQLPGPVVIINTKDANRIVESIELDSDSLVNEPVASTESNDLALSTLDPNSKPAC